jgi:hypothetical protein
MIGGGLQQTIAQLGKMPTQQLAAMTKDPQMGYLALTELRSRNQMRARMQQPQPPGPGTVADKEAMQALSAEQSGIMGNIPMQPQAGFAQGGVVGFVEGGSVEERAAAQRLASSTNLTYDQALEIVRKANVPLSAKGSPLDFFGGLYNKARPALHRLGVLSGGEIPVGWAGGVGPMPAAGNGVPYADSSDTRGPGPTEEPAPDNAWMAALFPTTAPAAAAAKPPGTPPPPPGADGGSERSSASIRMSGSGGMGGAGIGNFSVPGLTEYLTKGMVDAELAARNASMEARKQHLYKAPTREEQQLGEDANIARQQQLNPLDPTFLEAAARLQKNIRDVEGNEPTNRRQAFINAGLGMLANTNQFFGPGIGEGGQQGMKLYQELQSADKRRMDNLNAAQLDVGKGQMAWRKGNVDSGIAALAAEQARKKMEQDAALGQVDREYQHAGAPREVAKDRQGMYAQASQAQYQQAHSAALPIQLRNDTTRANAAALGASIAARRAQDDEKANAAFRRDYTATEAEVRKTLEGASFNSLKQQLAEAEKKGMSREQFVKAMALQRMMVKYAGDPIMTERLDASLRMLGGGLPGMGGGGSKQIPDNAAGVQLGNRE